MKRILNLVVQDRNDPNSTFVESFALRDDIREPEQPLRRAVSEFVNSGTAEALKAISRANGHFNWGDAMSAVPRELFARHGLTPLDQSSIDIFVDHDETLYDSEDEDMPDQTT
jgi:hypothetical protein